MQFSWLIVVKILRPLSSQAKFLLCPWQLLSKGLIVYIRFIVAKCDSEGEIFSGIGCTGLSRAGGTASGGREERLAASGGRRAGRTVRVIWRGMWRAAGG